MIRKIMTLIIVVTMLSATAIAQDRRSKLKRGTINLATGWVELPRNIYDTSVEDSRLHAATIGVIRGFGMFMVRTGAGVYEIVTAPFPIPDGYKPILYPKYVLDHN
jgi:putative exosortase-associated protein (TIGR04073 family)